MAEMSEPSIEVDSSEDHPHAEGIVPSTELPHLDEIKAPRELLDSLPNNLQEVKDALPKATSFSVLVCGRTGTGKSTLVNGIIGKRVAKEGDKVIEHGETSETVRYSMKIDDVDVTVWDSPGLQDGSDNDVQSGYISDMREKCSTVNLTLYCVKMIEKRFPHSRSDNPDVNAMARITEVFGPDFWRNTIVVLTFANVVEAVNADWEDLDISAKKEAFEKEVKSWRDIIQRVLMEEINVPEEIAKSVVVVPAGHSRKHKLPDRDYWLSTLWGECIGVTNTPESKLALVRINATRIRRQNQVNEAEFERPLEDQPIVAEGLTNIDGARLAALAVIVGVGAAIFGAGVGAGAATMGAGVGTAALGGAGLGTAAFGGAGAGAATVGAGVATVGAGVGAGAATVGAGVATVGAGVGAGAATVGAGVGTAALVEAGLGTAAALGTAALVGAGAGAATVGAGVATAGARVGTAALVEAGAGVATVGAGVGTAALVEAGLGTAAALGTAALVGAGAGAATVGAGVATAGARVGTAALVEAGAGVAAVGAGVATAGAGAGAGAAGAGGIGAAAAGIGLGGTAVLGAVTVIAIPLVAGLILYGIGRGSK